MYLDKHTIKINNNKIKDYLSYLTQEFHNYWVNTQAKCFWIKAKFRHLNHSEINNYYSTIDNYLYRLERCLIYIRRAWKYWKRGSYNKSMEYLNAIWVYLFLNDKSINISFYIISKFKCEKDINDFHSELLDKNREFLDVIFQLIENLKIGQNENI